MNHSDRPGIGVGDSLGAFVDLLRLAASKVSSEYMQLPRYSGEPDLDGGAILLERVYCYELYHQVRVRIDRKRSGPLPHALAAGWRLNAEVAKASSYVDKNCTPDFIWHHPGQPWNGLVIEVKPAAESRGRIAADVRKLERFREKAGYRRAMLFVVGTHASTHGYFDDLVNQAALANVDLLFHQRAGSIPTSDYRDVPEQL